MYYKFRITRFKKTKKIQERTSLKRGHIKKYHNTERCNLQISIILRTVKGNVLLVFGRRFSKHLMHLLTEKLVLNDYMFKLA